MIEELEEKKNEVLKVTYENVNADFGSIFSTLLPGTSAKLEPCDGMTILDGLEVKVAFGGVWKETLTELSGGQRYVRAAEQIADRNEKNERLNEKPPKTDHCWRCH